MAKMHLNSYHNGNVFLVHKVPILKGVDVILNFLKRYTKNKKKPKDFKRLKSYKRLNSLKSLKNLKDSKALKASKVSKYYIFVCPITYVRNGMFRSCVTILLIHFVYYKKKILGQWHPGHLRLSKLKKNES